MEARSLFATFDILDNITRPLENITRMINELERRQVRIQVGSIGQITGAASGAQRAIEGVTSATKGAADVIQNTGTKSASAFKNIQNSVNDLNSSISNVVQAAAGMTIGGVVAGLSWLRAEKAKLYEEQVLKAIDANKKLGISSKQAQERIDEVVATGATSRSRMLESIQVATLYGRKVGVKKEKMLDLAEAGEKIALGKQESLRGMSGADLIRMSSIRPKALRPEMESQFRTATADIAGEMPGYERLIKTAKGRAKILLEQGEKLSFDVEIGKRPWAEAMIQLESLQEAVGTAIAGPLKTVTKLFTGLIETIKNFPGGAALIGWVAIIFSAMSAMALLNSIITPTIALMHALAAATTRESLAKVWNRIVTLLSIPVRTTAAVAIMAETGAAEAATVANTAMGASLWTALAPVLLFLVPLIALGAILYLVEQKTHIFSKALKEIGRTQMARDILSWFQGLGKWMNETIRSIDAFYKRMKESGALKVVFDFLLLPFTAVIKVLFIIADFLSKLIGGQSFLNSLFQGAMAIWKKVSDFLSWLYETLKNLWSWLMTAIPGAEKASAQKGLQEKLGTEFEYAPSREGVPYLKIKKTGKEISARELSELIGPNAWPGGETEAYGHVPPMTRKQYIQIFGSAGGTTKGAYEKYESAPGFLEDLATKVADAVSGALVNLPSTIASAIAKSLGLAPILTSLDSAIKKLSEVLDRLFPGTAGPEQLGTEEKASMMKLLEEKGIKLHTTKLGGKDFYEYEKGGKLLGPEELKELGLERFEEGGPVSPLGTKQPTMGSAPRASPIIPEIPNPLNREVNLGTTSNDNIVSGITPIRGGTPAIGAGKGFEAARSLIAEGKTREAALALGLNPDAIYTSANMPKGESGAALAIRVSEWGPEILEKFSGPGIGVIGTSEGRSSGGKDDDSTTEDGGGSWWDTEVDLGTPSVYGEGEAPDARTSDEPVYSFQAGATFRRGGLISAKVHPPEEIIPQAIAQKGPGPISKAIEMLQLRGIRSVDRPEINNNHIFIRGAQIRIDKVASDIDINRLLNLVDKQTRESVKNALAQRRT